MKLLFIIFISLSVTYSQCDANYDGNLDVLDIISQVNCILEDCWVNQNSQNILGYWLMDEGHVEQYVDDTLLIEDFIVCGEGQDTFNYLMYFGENSEGAFMNVDSSNCGQNQVDISNPAQVVPWSYQFTNNNTIDFAGHSWTIVNIDNNNLVLEFTQYFDNPMINFDFQIVTYYMNRVEIISD